MRIIKRIFIFLLFLIPTWIWVGALMLFALVQFMELFPKFPSEIALAITYGAPLLLAGFLAFYLSRKKTLKWLFLASWILGFLGWVVGESLVAKYLTALSEHQRETEKYPPGSADLVDPYGDDRL